MIFKDHYWFVHRDDREYSISFSESLGVCINKARRFLHGSTQDHVTVYGSTDVRSIPKLVMKVAKKEI